jgi:hypothetical protein
VKRYVLLECSSPTVTLIPGTSSSLSSPISFRRNQDFYILSMIELNCHNSFSTTTQWTIKNCSLNCSNNIQFDETIITTFSEIFIPARTLSYGIYQLKLVVTSNLTSSSSVFVQIIPSGMIANFFLLGTSMITNGYQQDLVLNPGRFSIDLDGYPFNASVSYILLFEVLIAIRCFLELEL